MRLHLKPTFLGDHNMYVDPGTGSVLLQIILGAILGGGVAIKLLWKRISALFGKKEPHDPQP